MTYRIGDKVRDKYNPSRYGYVAAMRDGNEVLNIEIANDKNAKKGWDKSVRTAELQKYNPIASNTYWAVYVTDIEYFEFGESKTWPNLFPRIVS